MANEVDRLVVAHMEEGAPWPFGCRGNNGCELCRLARFRQNYPGTYLDVVRLDGPQILHQLMLRRLRLGD